MPPPKDPKKRAAWMEANRKWHLGRHLSPGTEFKKGQAPWNKGKHRTRESINKQRKKLLGKHHSPRTEFKKGHVSWLKGTKGLVKKNSGSFKKGHKSYWEGRHLSKEHVRKVLTRRTPSSLEKKFVGIIERNKLPYKFVGSGSFFIEQYNPDFINTNSEKIAVEVYASFHKKRLFGSIEKWKEERRAIFKKYGWEIIYFDETQVIEKFVLSKLERC